MPDVKRTMAYEEWFEEFKPIINHFDEKSASFEGRMFETYGVDLQFAEAAPRKKVWTLLDCDGKLILCNGFHVVNRFGYFITEVDAQEEIEIVVNNGDDDLDNDES
jgi:hypothetical protein